MDLASRNEIITEFNRIKELGFLKSRRRNNTGIGKTFEDHLGVDENNIKEPDFMGFEVKSQRFLTGSYVTLFTKSPLPYGINSKLRVTYGAEYEEYPGLHKLHTSMFANRYNSFMNKYGFSLDVNDENETIRILVKDLETDELLSNEAYYNYEDLRTAISSKLRALFLVTAESRRIDGHEHFHYTNASIYYNLLFDRFIEKLKDGTIMYDIRIGSYKTGKNKGKSHDHGSGFRIKRDQFETIFEDHFDVE